MRGRKDNRTRSVDRIDSGGEDFDGLDADKIVYGNLHARADGLADPVALHGDDALGPSAFEFFQVFEKLLSVVGGLEEPLLDFAGLDESVFVTPAIAAVDDLFVGQHGAELGTPVDAALLAVGEAALEHAQKEPLIPAIVLGIAGRNFAAPIIAEAEAAQDALEFGDVVVGPGAWVCVVLDGGVFGGQAEGIPAHGMQHIETAHTLYAGHHVADGVIAHVAHVHRARGIGQHLQRVILGLSGIYFRFEDARLGPALLPLSFDFLWVVFRHAELSPSAFFWLRGRFLCGL